MTEANSIPSPTQSKPSKPYPEFPLFPHASGRWAKKICGRFAYFGNWADDLKGERALAKYEAEKESLHSGRVPRATAGGTTVKELCNQFLNAKRERTTSGELSTRTFADYKAACVLLIGEFGKFRLLTDMVPADFEALRGRMAKRWGPVRLGNVIQRIRTVFKYAADHDLIDRPIRFGEFRRPSKKTLRKERHKHAAKMFAPDEVRRLLEAAHVQVRAMIMLGINCGYGNADCGTLPMRAIDLDKPMIDYPRPKTEMPRRCPLWPETVKALREAIADRPAPKNTADVDRVFITRFGGSWHKDPVIDPRTHEASPSDSPISKEFSKLLKSLHINGRKGLGFYTLRHTFRTIADEAKDQPAADFIMGHESSHMSSHYRESISDERLKDVVEHVRAWLYGGNTAR